MSIVIPTLRDSALLAAAIESIATGPDPSIEIIVANGGTHDGRLAELEAGARHVRVMSSLPGRGRQMNAGARAARGRWLLFLHADTRLTPGWLADLRAIDPNPGVVAGSFRFALDSPTRWARLIERAVAARVRALNLPFGDQALFVRRDVFAAIEGYRETAVMEDVDFVCRVRRAGQLHHSRRPAVTSARRWETEGWLFRSVANVALLVLFFLGVSPTRLARMYRSRAAGDPPRSAVGDA